MRRRYPDRSARARLALAASLITCGIAIVAIALACGSGESSSPEPAVAPAEPEHAAPPPGAAVEPAAETPEIPAASDEELTGELETGALPQGYPEDVPVYPDATPGPSIMGPGKDLFATFKSTDSVARIVIRYHDELKKGGWSVYDTESGDGVDATKDGRSVQVRARPSEEGWTEIAVDISGG